MEAIAVRVRRMVDDQYRCYRDQVVPALAASGIDLLTVDDLDEKGKRWAADYFEREVFPVLTPLAVPPSETELRLGKKARRYAPVGAPFTRSGGGLAHWRRECGGARAALGPDRCRVPYESESVGVRGAFKLGIEENVPVKV